MPATSADMTAARVGKFINTGGGARDLACSGSGPKRFGPRVPCRKPSTTMPQSINSSPISDRMSVRVSFPCLSTVLAALPRIHGKM